MKNIKGIISFFLAIMMLASLVGCGGDSSGADTTKYEKISMYLIDEKPRDYDEVLARVNEKLKASINTEVEVKWIAPGDASKKYQLLLQSGEPIDLIYSTTWTDYTGCAQKGGFAELDELLPKYAPKLYEKLNKEAIDCLLVDGKLYSVPANEPSISPTGYAVRGDLMDKYGIESIDDFEDFWAYLDAVKSGEDMIPYNCNAGDALMSTYLREKGWNSGKNSFVYYKYDDIRDTKYLWNVPVFKDYLKLTQEGFKKGFWSKDILMSKNTAQVNFENGVSAAAILGLKNFEATYLKLQEIHPEWDIRWYIAGEQYPDIINQYGGMSIGASSKNPERAMMVLEQICNDQELSELLMYGIKGKHFDKDEDGNLVLLDQDGFTADEAGNWGFTQQEYILKMSDGWSEKNKIEEDRFKVAEYSPLGSFFFNTETVVNEISAITNVSKQYATLVIWGTVDLESGYNELMKQLSIAGLEKVENEYITQVNKYFEENGK